MPMPSSEDAALRAIIREGSKSFYAASRLLPRDVRDAAFALYAFCREADDIVDLGDGGADAIDKLNRRVERAYTGSPEDRVIDRAFSRAVHKHAIPKTLPLALIEGLAWDADGRRFDTLDALHAYAARVAGTVGAMMTCAMGVRSADALARATDLGAAMQLTNIARDVGEDARNGRIYLPLNWLRDAGLVPDVWLRDPRPIAPIRDATARLLDEADRLHQRGLAGVRLLPVRCRPAIAAAGLIYSDIGRIVRANGHDSVSGRAVVSGRRKAMLALGALGPRSAPVSSLKAPALAANQFLVSATRDASSPERSPALSPAARMLDICLKAEARQRDTALG